MAPRDYKNRGRAPRKKPIPEPVKQTSKFKIFLILFFTVIVTSVFSYFLFSISGQAEKQPDLEKASTPIKPEVKPLPAKPVEKWEYIDELKDKQIIVDVPERIESNKRYQLQCASFRQKNQAEKLKAKIAFLGLESQIKYTSSSNGSAWYRVVLGPYKKRDAEKDRHKLQNNKINGCKMWLWNW